jgi:hypothetical protein
MIMVMRRYELLHGGLLPSNPWESSRRLRVGKSAANRPWPRPVLTAVLAAATPAECFSRYCVISCRFFR